MPVWYEQGNVAHRLGHPFVHPGGPSVVAEPAAARRQSVQQFQDEATAAWCDLLSNIDDGLQQQDQAEQQQNAIQQDHENPQQQQQQRQHASLDLSGLAVPLLPRRRLTGPVMLVPQPDPTPPGMTPEQAASAAVAAAVAAQPAGTPGPLDTLVVPAGCLQLHSWQESAAAEEPPGEVVSSTVASVVPAASAGAAGADDVLLPGSEVLVTLSVMDTSRLLNVVQQEIQALGSNTLADIRDTIICPTDSLAEGLGASNPAAYFYIDRCFYDDTRSTTAVECSQQVAHWVRRLGFAGPKHLLNHFDTLQEVEQHEQPPTQQQQESAEAAAATAAADADLVVDAQQQQAQQEQQQQPQQQPQPHRDMQHVRLSELVLQASNRPMALFSHQGLCEHAVLISDVRLLHAADPSRRSMYPRTVSKAALGRRLQCGMCKRLGATALMLDHPETPEAVIVLCRLCCGLFSIDQHPGAKLIMLEPF